ncbi:unnamed protein product [Trypanosoma congolense IL3000]|uniref:WGS project CAEQ00000000 data, annotated contig 143 n=1 Tax=Trypanosoma congolense (strain IL3000) TaxID=1068625 RepID=F9W694_TRYCI|nr:unnamed protein product [Trypanosoma congolense IL3000]
MTPLPACCTPLDDHWPLPVSLPGTVFLSTRFDPALLSHGDFQRCDVPPPASIQRSVAKRQAEFLAGRLCAREALQRLDHLHCIPAIGEDRSPVWPGHISGSITHSTGHAAAIVGHKAQWRGLGMDLEHLLTVERAERLAGEILTADELQRMAALPREQHALLVTLTFSVKESLFKALYPIVHKRFYFEHAEVLEWSAAGRVRLRLLTDLRKSGAMAKSWKGSLWCKGSSC